MKAFEINLGSVRYPVKVGGGIFSDLVEWMIKVANSDNIYVIVDRFIHQKYENQFIELQKVASANIFVMKAGKDNKTFSTAMKIFADLDEKNVSRDVTLFAVGGGVVGDLAGFISSCWYRGVKLVHIPTTLLSAVDSCVGGKTAINFRDTVNAVGTYHHPVAILIDTDVLLELPSREIASGFGEIVKYATLGSNEITEILEGECELNSELLGTLVALSLKEKERFVRGDVHEAANRLFLNFGHTIGHAIEFSTVFNGEEMLRHGEGVALGMVAIFRVCIELGLLSEEDLSRLKLILEKFSLPTTFSSSAMSIATDTLREKVVDMSFKDKKRTSESLRLVVLDGWGRPTIHKSSDKSLIKLGVAEVIV